VSWITDRVGFAPPTFPAAEGEILLAAVRHLPGAGRPHGDRRDVRRGRLANGNLRGHGQEFFRQALCELRGNGLGLIPEADRSGNADDPWRRPAIGEDSGEDAVSEGLTARRKAAKF
jgi:hypothetical protein